MKLKIAYRRELCALPNHDGIAIETLGPVQCRVNYRLLIDVLVAKRLRGLADSAGSAEKSDVRIYPAPSEPPVALRMVAG